MNNNNVNIDEQLKKVLENLEVPYNASHWDKMVQKLDALDAEEAAFDQRIRENLNSDEVPYQPQHWDLMRQKLDDLEKSDAVFDDSVRRRLFDSEPAYKPSHWNIMETRLDQEVSWRTKIVRFKVVELALMLFAIFTVFNVLDTEGPRGEPIQTLREVPANTSEAPSAPSTAPAKQFKRGNDWRSRGNDVKNKVKSSQNAEPIAAVETVKQGENAVSNVQDIIKSDIAKSDIAQTVSAPSATAAADAHLKNAAAETVASAVASLSTNSDNLASIGAFDPSNEVPFNTPPHLPNAVEVVKPVDLRSINTLADNQTKAPIIIKNKKDGGKWRLGVVATPIIDLVTTHYRRGNDLYAVKSYNLNKSAGLTLGFKKGRVEVESGVSFASKRYAPPQVEITTGTFETGYVTERPKNVELNILSVPLSMNITTKKSRRFNVYAHLGATFNSILTTIDRREILLNGSNNFAQSAQPRTNPVSQRVDLPTYGLGAAEGGKLSENVYATARLGMGAEYRITPRWSVYVQPTYEHHFGKSGIGSFDDRMSSLNLQAGIKSQFALPKHR